MSELPLDPIFPNLTREDYIKNIKMMVTSHNEVVDLIIEKGGLYGLEIPRKKAGHHFKARY